MLVRTYLFTLLFVNFQAMLAGDLVPEDYTYEKNTDITPPDTEEATAAAKERAAQDARNAKTVRTATLPRSASAQEHAQKLIENLNQETTDRQINNRTITPEKREETRAAETALALHHQIRTTNGQTALGRLNLNLNATTEAISTGITSMVNQLGEFNSDNLVQLRNLIANDSSAITSQINTVEQALQTIDRTQITTGSSALLQNARNMLQQDLTTLNQTLRNLNTDINTLSVQENRNALKAPLDLLNRYVSRMKTDARAYVNDLSSIQKTNQILDAQSAIPQELQSLRTIFNSEKANLTYAQKQDILNTVQETIQNLKQSLEGLSDSEKKIVNQKIATLMLIEKDSTMALFEKNTSLFKNLLNAIINWLSSLFESNTSGIIENASINSLITSIKNLKSSYQDSETELSPAKPAKAPATLTPEEREAALQQLQIRALIPKANNMLSVITKGETNFTPQEIPTIAQDIRTAAANNPNLLQATIQIIKANIAAGQVFYQPLLNELGAS